jgi:hypothetical protein
LCRKEPSCFFVDVECGDDILAVGAKVVFRHIACWGKHFTNRVIGEKCAWDEISDDKHSDVGGGAGRWSEKRIFWHWIAAELGFTAELGWRVEVISRGCRRRM